MFGPAGPSGSPWPSHSPYSIRTPSPWGWIFQARTCSTRSASRPWFFAAFAWMRSQKRTHRRWMRAPSGVQLRALRGVVNTKASERIAEAASKL